MKQLKAVMTLYEAPAYRQGVALSSSRTVYEHVKGQERSGREIMTALLLDAKNKLMHVETLGVGTVDATAVYPRELLRAMLFCQASSVILVHNHPSGDPEPSLADKELTRDVVFAAKLMQMKLLDHVILGDGNYYSMGDQGLIEEYELAAIRR